MMLFNFILNDYAELALELRIQSLDKHKHSFSDTFSNFLINFSFFFCGLLTAFFGLRTLRIRGIDLITGLRP